MAGCTAGLASSQTDRGASEGPRGYGADASAGQCGDGAICPSRPPEIASLHDGGWPPPGEAGIATADGPSPDVLKTDLADPHAGQLDGAPSGKDLAGTGKHYYLSSSGSDSNPGTPAAPFATFAKANSVVKPGDTVHVMNGSTFKLAASGSGAVNTTTSGTAGARIRWVSDTRWGAKIICTSSGYTFVWYNKASYVDIIGFDISCPACSVGLRNFASNARMIGNHVHDIPGEPGCTSNGGAGINNGNYTSADNDIIGNVVHDIGPKPTGSCNKIHGIYHSTLRGHIWNNVSYNNSGWGITTWHAANAEIIANNTLFANGGFNGTAYVGGGILIGDGDAPGGVVNDNVVVANNIIYKNPGIGLREYGNVGSHNIYANNLINGNGLDTFELNHGNTPTGTVTADPQFVNYMGSFFGGDLHLKPTSPAVDKGTATGAPSTDLEGGARPHGAGYDIGAYEHEAAPAAAWPWLF